MNRFIKGLKKTSSWGGFTITEVIIVMAIAGVIMATILAVVPQAQRNQRDNARKAIAQRLISSLENYNSNNQGAYPFVSVNSTSWVACNTGVASATSGDCKDWFFNYIYNRINIKDPSKNVDVRVFYSSKTTSPAPAWASGDIYIGVGDQCSGSALSAGPVQPGSASSKQFAMVMEMETSGNWYCVDNR